MAANSPVQDPSTDTSPKQSAPSEDPITPPVKIETTPANSGQAPASALPATPQQQEPPPPAPLDLVHVPSYSRWFSWNDIQQCEVRFLPEFFDSRSPSKTPRVYKYIRNSIIRKFRESPSKKITFTDIRKTLVSDVGSIRRVFDFLEAWGLVNYSPSALNKPLKWEDRETKSSASATKSAGAGGSSADSSTSKEASKRICSGCKSVCSIACFACDKFDLTLCARCYVRGNYRVGVSSSDFRRVEISEESKTDWTDKETLHLLEALMHYGEDWRKIAQHVGGRTEKECVVHFLKLPLGEQFAGYPDSENIDSDHIEVNDHASTDLSGRSNPSKRIRLSPLADASNPIMAQAAFLASLVGVEIAEAAAQAAVNKLSDISFEGSRESGTAVVRTIEERGNFTASSSGDNNAMSTYEESLVDANSQLKKEELDVEKAISGIVGVQMKEIVDKLVRFEELDLQVEKANQQLDQMRSMLFVDQLNILFHKNCIPDNPQHKGDENVGTC